MIACVGGVSLIAHAFIALARAVTDGIPQAGLTVLAESAGALIAATVALSWGLVARPNSQNASLTRWREDVALLVAVAGLLVSHVVSGASGGEVNAPDFTFDGFSAALSAGAFSPTHLLTTAVTLLGIALWRCRDWLPRTR